METNGDGAAFQEPGAMIENNEDAGGKDAKKGGGKKRLSVERIYQKKTQLEHILLRPDTYIGSVEPLTQCEEGGGDEDGAPKVKKEKYKPSTSLNRAQEQALVEWFSKQPIFFDQSHADFKSKQRKVDMLDEKAKEFGLTGIELGVWFKSQRTIYGRINKKKRLQSKNLAGNCKSLTRRQKWVLDNFAFLKSHIVIRTPDRRPVKKKGKRLSIAMLKEDDEDSSEEETDTEQMTRDKTGAKYSNPSNTGDEPGPSKQYQVHRTQKDDVRTNDTRTKDTLLTLVQKLVSENNCKKEQIESSRVNNNPRVAWTQWMGEELKEIPDTLWTEFQKESFAMIMRFKDLSQSQEVPFSTANEATNEPSISHESNAT